ncbi:hypothetical protein RC083_05085 [Pseudoalteromonas haloplanktis]|uniref:Uncharacterized protein n=1 Tax=Pseudoalteromonas haloplanktis TaxID=228 RepID=A0ABU1B9R4_PSEHA|nr:MULTISPECIES: hypothetical protein [Pseudoalteromonas]MDQ9090967.1 hypothetical protein [Pseudoalteromonas haloplanktis]BDF93345.1 hypothetical protein KAN5_01830 [Pseudoalteromonas sp. KAN5]
MKNDILNTKKLGYKFYFQDGDDQIACFGSYFTGKEEVYVNDELVSEKRSINVTSKHQFELSGNTFNVKFEMHNILTGRLECSLYKNKKLVKSYQQSSLFNNPKTSLKVMVGCFLGGLAGGFILISILEFLLGEF